jgi:N-methylhydantoinase A
VVIPLQEADVTKALDHFEKIGVEAIAISFLWSFQNPSHEKRVRDMVRARFPTMFISCSHEVSSRIGEYGRTVSTVMNAAIGPLMLGYIDGIVKGAKERGLPGDVLFALCEGGLVAADEARKHPLDTVQSGPVAAVVGCAAAGQRMSFPNVIVTDMGGTTLDVATVVEGEVAFSEESVLERHRVYLRKVDVDSVGAGGGSIAWIHEETGALRVGPQSAGAMPGPICYGRGGTQVTVTDADLVLGILNPDRALAGGLKLDVAAARKGVEALAKKLGMSTMECAAGIVEIVDSRMEDLIRRVTIQRGQDPRSFVLWACGGASGAHAGLFGKHIGVKEAVFPLNDLASVWSAYGLAQLEPSRTFQASVLFRTPLDLKAVAETIHALEKQAAEYSRSQGFPDFYLRRHADMKFSLQVYEVETAVPDGEINDAWARQLLETFYTTYDSRFGEGSGYKGAGAVITTLRVTVASKTEKIPLFHDDTKARAAQPQAARPVYWNENRALTDTPVYWGPDLKSGNTLPGPGIIEYPNTTIAVRPGQTLRIDGFGNAVLTLEADQ